MWFESWSSIARTAITGVGAYAALVLMLRSSGKRTLSKLNAFDLVVTVALGSTLASVITSADVPLANGVVALATLIGLQYAVAWSSSRWRPVSRVVKSEPRVLFHAGAFARDAMRDERVTEDEVLAAIRGSPVGSIDEVDAVILESSGELSVLRAAKPAQERATRRPRTATGADALLGGTAGADGGAS